MFNTDFSTQDLLYTGACFKYEMAKWCREKKIMKQTTGYSRKYPYIIPVYTKTSYKHRPVIQWSKSNWKSTYCKTKLLNITFPAMTFVVLIKCLVTKLEASLTCLQTLLRKILCRVCCGMPNNLCLQSENWWRNNGHSINKKGVSKCKIDVHKVRVQRNVRVIQTIAMMTYPDLPLLSPSP